MNKIRMLSHLHKERKKIGGKPEWRQLEVVPLRADGPLQVNEKFSGYRLVTPKPKGLKPAPFGPAACAGHGCQAAGLMLAGLEESREPPNKSGSGFLRRFFCGKEGLVVTPVHAIFFNRSRGRKRQGWLAGAQFLAARLFLHRPAGEISKE